MTTLELLDGVEAFLTPLFPNEPIYRDEVPVEGKRPALFLRTGKVSPQSLGGQVVEITVPVVIEQYVTGDAYHNYSSHDIVERNDRITSAFLHDAIHLPAPANRWVDVDSIDTEAAENGGVVTVTLRWADDEVVIPPDIDPATDYNMNLNIKE